MTRLFLVRHGQSTWNAQGRIQGWADPPLDETGHEQARRLALRLAAEEHGVSAIYSSPLLRARQTAEAVGLALELTVQTDDRLKENDSLPFQFDNTSLSVVKVGERRVRLFKLNDTAHLANGIR
jgi:broad specificity phosphatase PhoE